MTSMHCPGCYAPVTVAPHARDGRCATCKQFGRRQHSQPRWHKRRRDPIDDLLTDPVNPCQ